jgi:hypothetical protein
VLSPSATYYVDVVHARSAEMMAANKLSTHHSLFFASRSLGYLTYSSGLRALVLSIAIAGILPCINRIGIAGTNALPAAFAWLGFG